MGAMLFYGQVAVQWEVMAIAIACGTGGPRAPMAGGGSRSAGEVREGKRGRGEGRGVRECVAWRGWVQYFL